MFSPSDPSDRRSSPTSCRNVALGTDIRPKAGQHNFGKVRPTFAKVCRFRPKLSKLWASSANIYSSSEVANKSSTSARTGQTLMASFRRFGPALTTSWPSFDEALPKLANCWPKCADSWSSWARRDQTLSEFRRCWPKAAKVWSTSAQIRPKSAPPPCRPTSARPPPYDPCARRPTHDRPPARPALPCALARPPARTVRPASREAAEPILWVPGVVRRGRALLIWPPGQAHMIWSGVPLGTRTPSSGAPAPCAHRKRWGHAAPAAERCALNVAAEERARGRPLGRRSAPPWRARWPARVRARRAV